MMVRTAFARAWLLSPRRGEGDMQTSISISLPCGWKGRRGRLATGVAIGQVAGRRSCQPISRGSQGDEQVSVVFSQIQWPAEYVLRPLLGRLVGHVESSAF